MATGATGDYWKDARLPGILKHGVLRRYLPIFLARTSSFGGDAVVIDGYAGRPFYEDGKPGSAGLTLQWALERKLDRRSANYILRFFEKDRESFDLLQTAVAEYASKGVDVRAERVDVAKRFADAVEEASGKPLFLFIDPTGLALPFDDLVAALNRPTTSANWPPTELLMNFSWNAVRRIGGLVRSPNANETSMQSLDLRLGGDWWREHFELGVTDEAVENVVQGFIDRLAKATSMWVGSVPVKRDVHHKPVYSLVYATRNSRGAWHFSDVVAKSAEEWRIAADKKAGSLELSPTMKDLENSALEDIEANLLEISEVRGEFTVGDFPIAVLKGHIGEVGEKVVRQAIKSLHKKGLSPSTGIGGKTENLRFRANP